MKNKLGIIINEKQPTQIYDNTASDVLQITIDKLKLKLKNYEEAIRLKDTTIALASLFISILLVFGRKQFLESFLLIINLLINIKYYGRF